MVYQSGPKPPFFLSMFTFLITFVLDAHVFFVLCSPQLAYLLAQFQYFVCPVGFNSETNRFTVECERSDIFVMQEYTLPTVLQNTLEWVRLSSSFLRARLLRSFPAPRFNSRTPEKLCIMHRVKWPFEMTFQCLLYVFSSPFQKTVNLYPFTIHSIFLSSFASLIGPFGGFFASGFKRAFKIKVKSISVSSSYADLHVQRRHTRGDDVLPELYLLLFNKATYSDGKKYLATS